MPGFENTALWRGTLGAETQGDEDARHRLRTAYLLVRERAAVLAAEIPLDLREYTVHDASHLDALWETGNDIIGPDLGLNPAEGFVLGCAFLIHDLGMGLAAYPGGMADLEAMDVWPGILAASVEQLLGRPALPDDVDNASDDARRNAKEIALRELHARQAESLATISWTSSTGALYHLIEDQGLRDAFGPLIGRIAHSHWWDVSRLPDEFTTVGGAVDLPSDWSVNSLVLACILRLADAAHLDARRAPGFLMALRKPSGYSLQHWTFQNYLQRVQRRDDRLYYTSTHRFTSAEAPSWWLCLETLRMVDAELRSVDSLLADLGLPRLAARGVFGVEEPKRLAKVIATDGWIPVDAQVIVGDVASLVFKLGGAELYGDNPEVAVRELIANGTDAVCYRQALEPAGDYNAYVAIRLEERPDGHYLEVFDNGIGMSEDVMTGALLDFGRSFWGSSLMRREFPGLAGSGHRATGRYGIGFFSVFMLGSNVEVRSRRFDLGADDTRVLEFREGLAHRPLLRKALASERLTSGGTLVRIRLASPPNSDQGLYRNASDGEGSLRGLVSWIAPASRVELRVSDVGEGNPVAVVKGDDWKLLDSATLFGRLYGGAFDPYQQVNGGMSDFPEKLADVALAGEVVARLSLANATGQGPNYAVPAVVTVGGLRAGSVGGISGLLRGQPDRASRESSIPDVPLEALREWADGRFEEIDTSKFTTLDQRHLAEILGAFGAYQPELPLCLSAARALNYEDLEKWAATRDLIELVWESQTTQEEADDGRITYFAYSGGDRYVKVEVLDHVLFASSMGDWLESGYSARYGGTWPQLHADALEGVSDKAAVWWRAHGGTSIGRIVERIAHAWAVELNAVVAALELPARDRSQLHLAIGVTEKGDSIFSARLASVVRPEAS